MVEVPVLSMHLLCDDCTWLSHFLSTTLEQGILSEKQCATNVFKSGLGSTWMHLRTWSL